MQVKPGVVQAPVGRVAVAEPADKELSFGERFVEEALRLGVHLPSSQADRLRTASRGQIMCAVEKRLPTVHRDLLRAIARKSPEGIARELALAKPPEGIVHSMSEAVDAAYGIDMVGDILINLADDLFTGLDLS